MRARLLVAALALWVGGCGDSGLPGPQDLAGADLTGITFDLSGADLIGVDLANGCGMTCNMPFVCCAGLCRNLQNDPSNCGMCGKGCPVGSTFCSGGTCGQPMCFGTVCIGTKFCCGQNCCDIGQICCEVEGPGPSTGPRCHTPVPGEPTCPLGCPLCQ